MCVQPRFSNHICLPRLTKNVSRFPHLQNTLHPNCSWSRRVLDAGGVSPQYAHEAYVATKYLGDKTYSRPRGKYWVVCPPAIFEPRLFAKVNNKNMSRLFPHSQNTLQASCKRPRRLCGTCCNPNYWHSTYDICMYSSHVFRVMKHVPAAMASFGRCVQPRLSDHICLPGITKKHQQVSPLA